MTIEEAKKAAEQKRATCFAVFPAPAGGYAVLKQGMEGVVEGIKAAEERGLDLSWLERRFLTREEADEYIKKITEEKENGQ